MPTKNQHLQKATHNENFLNALDISTTIYLDWLVTIAFYAALHFVDAYIALTYSKHPSKHQVRDNYIVKDTKLKRIIDGYWDLKNDSRQSRYNVYQFSVKEVKLDITKLQSIKNYILNLL